MRKLIENFLMLIGLIFFIYIGITKGEVYYRHHTVSAELKPFEFYLLILFYMVSLVLFIAYGVRSAVGDSKTFKIKRPAKNFDKKVMQKRKRRKKRK